MTPANKFYDKAKFVAQIGLPTLGTLYFAVAALWHLPAAEQVVGTITAVDAALGALLGLSTTAYNKTQEIEAANQAEAESDGDLMVGKVDGEHTLTLGVKDSVEALVSKDTVTLKVVNIPTENTSTSAPLPMS